MARDHFGTYVTPFDYDAAAQLGLSKANVRNRIALGWSAKRAISEPLNRPNQRCPEYKKYKQLALDNGISRTMFNDRVNKSKWTLEDAANTPPLSFDEVTKRANAAKRKQSGMPEEIEAIAHENGICRNLLVSRIRYRFWKPLEAATVPVGSRNAGRDYFKN